MIKTSGNIEPVTIGREDAGRYEYRDAQGTTECGDAAYRVEVENSGGSEHVYFRHRENAEAFIYDED
jgi:hypothetical protein